MTKSQQRQLQRRAERHRVQGTVHQCLSLAQREISSRGFSGSLSTDQGLLTIQEGVLK